MWLPKESASNCIPQQAALADVDHPDGGLDSQVWAIEQELSLQVLTKAAGFARFVHLHGTQIITPNIATLPCEVLHGEVQSANWVGLTDLRNLDPENKKAVMGGLSHHDLTQLSSAQIRTQIDEVLSRIGPRGLFFAPTCSVTPSIAKATLFGIRDYTRIASADLVDKSCR